MELIELFEVIAQAYPDEEPRKYYDAQTGGRITAADGDGLAGFLVDELAETFDDKATSIEQLDEAYRVVMMAISDLTSVAVALEQRKTMVIE